MNKKLITLSSVKNLISKLGHSMNKILKIYLISIIFINIIATPEDVINELFDVLKTGKNKDYIGEDISQLNHALQSAQQALNSKADLACVIAALFHDIGHLCSKSNAEQMGIYGTVNHEYIGANFLKQKGFGNKVFEIVKAHVDAKRYLVFKDKTYYNNLSSASKQTLELQGGPMTQAEALAFEQLPFFKEKILLRHWDEGAKVKNGKVPSIEFLK